MKARAALGVVLAGSSLAWADEALVKRLEQKAVALIGDARCSDDSHCRSITWGSMPCGGHERWLAWSTLRTDPQQLEAASKRYKAAKRAEDLRKGVLSACWSPGDPGVRCFESRCVLRPPLPLPVIGFSASPDAGVLRLAE